MSKVEILEKEKNIGRTWDKFSFPGHLNPKRIMYKEPYFTTEEYTYKGIFENLNNEFGGIKIKNVLEIGCGNANNLIYFIKNNISEKAVGIDVSKGALIGANKNIDYYGVEKSRINLLNSSFEDFSTNEKFDLIICLQVINYIPDLDLVFQKLKLLLRDGGHVLISDGQKPFFSIKSKLVRSKWFMNLLGKEVFDDYLIFHKYDKVIKKSTENNFNTKMSQFGFIWPFIYMDKLNFRLASHEYEIKLFRDISRAIYIINRYILSKSNKLFRKNCKGQIYYTLLKYKEQ